jgi:glycine/D-amino acid oxidase-like deaminating enzyme
MWAYLRRGQACGLSLHTHTQVLDFDLHGGRLRGVSTSRGKFSAGVVILCTGAWTPELGRQLGRNWAIQHVHGQAVVTETSNLRLQNHIASAAFFEDIEDSHSEGAVLALSQTAHGNFLLGEAAVVTTDTGSTTTPGGPVAIAQVISRYFPAMRRLRVLRGWGAPVAFTPDGLPYFGPVADVPGLILATAFQSTVIVTPLVGRTVAQLVQADQTDLDLTPFSPDRRLTGDQYSVFY